MPKHWFGPQSKTSKGRGHPLLFGKNESEYFGDFPDGGGYPYRFLQFAYRTLGVTNPAHVLHLCSGSMRIGIRLDIRNEVRPTVIADCRATPFKDATFCWIMADPPYSKDYAENLYRTGPMFPLPGQILAEAARLLTLGGRVGLLHFIVPIVRRPLFLLGVWGITTGAGYAIRAWSVLEKRDA